MSISCIEDNPTSQTVYLDGVAINISAVAFKTGHDKGYVSRVFAGKRMPNAAYAQDFADAIGFSLDRFVTAIKDKKRALHISLGHSVSLGSTHQKAS
ncbi:MAG: helix-turn-helix domain-containing protein [Nitrospiraceae bacterium]